MTSSIAFISSNPPFRPFDQVDAKVLALCRWFKNDYMRWVDPIRCPACGGPTFSAGTAPPDRTERCDGAARVELHVCKDKNCATERRFPRYGKVSTLLRTKEGRCGEWAHLFYVILRAKHIESRYVWNRYIGSSSTNDFADWKNPAKIMFGASTGLRLFDIGFMWIHGTITTCKWQARIKRAFLVKGP